MRLEGRLKKHALALGFDLAGIAPASPADGFERLQEWLAAGFAGSMAYMGRHEEARRHPASILPAVKSVLMVALNHGSFDGEPQPLSLRRQPADLTGKVARMRAARITMMFCAASSTSCLPGCKKKCPGARARCRRYGTAVGARFRAAPVWGGSARTPC